MYSYLYTDVRARCTCIMVTTSRSVVIEGRRIVIINISLNYCATTGYTENVNCKS